MKLMTSAKKLKRIAEGWKNFVFLSPMVEELAKVRAEICSGCTHAVKSTWMQSIGDRIEKAKGMVCDKCNCPISAKVRSIKEKCPDIPSKW